MNPLLAPSLVASFALVGVAFGGCAREDVVFADLPEASSAAPTTSLSASSSSSGKPPHSQGQPCVDNFECTFDSFCSRKSCDDQAGRCEKRPISCDLGLPVCGCDGSPFPSDCIRRAAGVSASRSCPPPP